MRKKKVKKILKRKKVSIEKYVLGKKNSLVKKGLEKKSLDKR